MKSTITTLMAGSFAVALLCPGASAQDDPPLIPDAPTPERYASSDEKSYDEDHASAIVRGSSLIGADVENATGETLGEVEDLVLARDGSVAAVLISGDEFGDGHAALPLDVLHPRLKSVEPDENGRLPNDREVEALTLDGRFATMLESAPRARVGQVFDRTFIQRVRQHFDLTTSGSMADVDESETRSEEHVRAFRLASKVMDKDVVNESSEDLGQIEDIAVAVDRAEVAYAVLECGGLLGIGEKRFAVPLDSLDTNGSDDEKLVLDIPRERLAQAKGFDRWPAHADRNLFAMSRRDMHEGTSRVDPDRHDGRTPTETARRNR